MTEILLILLFVAGWMLLVCLFFRKWGAIKNLQPRENRYKRGTPDNEEEVKVIEKEDEGVISCKESRSSKIAKFKRMRDFRLSQLKTGNFFSDKTQPDDGSTDV